MEQRSTEWHELRSKKIGASDAGPILGLSPYKTAYHIWLSKQPDYINEDNAAMKWGRELESEALRIFESETGYLMSPRVMISDQTEFLMASLDGYEIDGKCAVELKCPFHVNSHIKMMHEEIPLYYIAQMQHQMYVAELDEIYFCSYQPKYLVKPLYIKIVKRDDSFITDMIEKEKMFYEKHMLTGIPPKKSEHFKEVKSEHWNTLAMEYRKIDRSIKDAEKRKEEIRSELVKIAEEENAKGNGIILQKVERKGIINYQNIQILKTIDLEEYRKPSTSFWQVKDE